MPPEAHPPMGWNSWYAFGDKISDPLIRQQADIMLTNGMYDAGYRYVNLDDGWQGDRDALGILHPNENFPDMKGLADYVHSRGLKFGIYTSMGPKGCTGLTGSQGHEDQDAQTFIDWGVDFVKYDVCDFQPPDAIVEWSLIHRMSLALRSHETHPIVLSIVMLQSPWKWAPSLAVNMWRIGQDAENTYGNMMDIADFDARLAAYVRKTGWNDPDMLQVGRRGMTTDEYRTHMTLWSILAAPLIASTDLRFISPEDLEILTNDGVIGINQDGEDEQGKCMFHSQTIDLWVKKLSTGSAVAIVNRSDQTITHMLDSKYIGGGVTRVYDVWMKQTLSLPHAFSLPPHAAVLVKTL